MVAHADAVLANYRKVAPGQPADLATCSDAELAALAATTPHSDPRRPEDGWEDMEIFLGKEHHVKNMGIDGGCHDGACTIRKLGSEQEGGIVHPLPAPAVQKPSGGSGGAHRGYVVYGAEW
jgi:hypothetical protein